MERAVFLTGPTASGKTALAVELARKINAEIINADSIQVYKGLDVISGKDLSPQAKFYKISSFPGLSKKYNIGFFRSGRIKIYLLNVVSPDFPFSISDFFDISTRLISYINRKGKLPIIVGGNYFYFKALLDDMVTLQIPPDFSLREKLVKKTLDELLEMLKTANFKKFSRLNSSELKNKRRIMRALEIVYFRDKNKLKKIKRQKYKALLISLRMEKKELEKKIKQRVKDRLDKGALREAKQLFKNYANLTGNVKNAIGYKEMFAFLAGKIDFKAAVDSWLQAEIKLVKKQMTWFKKDKRIKWFAAKDEFMTEKIVKLVSNWYNK